MLKIQQCEDDLYIIELECVTKGGTIRFNSVFQQIPEINPKDLIPNINGMMLEVKFEGE